MEDTKIIIAPYFDVVPENLDAFKALWRPVVDQVKGDEPGNLYYAFLFNGTMAHCREAYTDADAVMTHLANVGGPLGEALKLSKLARIELHGPKEELEKLKPNMTHLPVEYYEYEFGYTK